MCTGEENKTREAEGCGEEHKKGLKWRQKHSTKVVERTREEGASERERGGGMSKSGVG